jgi:parvulin-like peptidyl-prolyl isomerase
MEEFEIYLKWQMGYMQENTEEEIVWDDIEEVSGVPYIDLAKDLTVDLLTETKVQTQEAEKRKITLTSEEEQYIEALVKYSVSESGELDAYELTEQDWIKIYKEYQLINKLTLEIANEELTPYDARHILLLTEEKTEDEKVAIKKKAQDLLDRVLAGEDFAKLASENSEDGGSVNNGGLYKGVAKGSFVSEFENAALSLKDGEIYPQLVESSYGYHIIKLEKKISDTQITQLDNNIYYNFLAIAYEWIENATVERGQQFATITI